MNILTKPGFLNDRKDNLDWDLNGSSQNPGGDFPRTFNRQHSQPQFTRQSSSDPFAHIPNGTIRNLILLAFFHLI